MTRTEIAGWVKEALSCKDQEYQLVEVCRTVAELERERCAKVAEDSTCWRGISMAPECGKKIAQRIRELLL